MGVQRGCFISFSADNPAQEIPCRVSSVTALISNERSTKGDKHVKRSHQTSLDSSANRPQDRGINGAIAKGHQLAAAQYPGSPFRTSQKRSPDRSSQERQRCHALSCHPGGGIMPKPPDLATEIATLSDLPIHLLRKRWNRTFNTSVPKGFS